MNSQTSTKNEKTAESAENISVMKRNIEIYNDVPTMSSEVVFVKVASAVHASWE